MDGVNGLHHITAIAGPAQENLDFYAGVLGMRLVKRSVNQDDPGTYHLFYADAAGNPGTDLTFFPWARTPKGRNGTSMSVEVPLAVPTGSLDYWADRLGRLGFFTAPVETRFGELTLPFQDPHGMNVALAETSDPRLFSQWDNSPVPVEYQMRGLHAARVFIPYAHKGSLCFSSIVGSDISKAKLVQVHRVHRFVTFIGQRGEPFVRLFGLIFPPGFHL